MIMPSKYLREDEALIGVSAELLKLIGENSNLSMLWETAKKNNAVGNFERFILSLDLLYLMGLIDFYNNKIIRIKYDS